MSLLQSELAAQTTHADAAETLRDEALNKEKEARGAIEAEMAKRKATEKKVKEQQELFTAG